jgi:adenosylcobinamide-GDP ribazoletransferase
VVLTALRGAVGFLSRIPVGNDETAWRAFRATPAAFPLAGYLVGVLVAVPLALATAGPALRTAGIPAPDPPFPAATAALLYPVALYGLTGITHLDGVADLGDASVVHGDPAERREVMTDTTVGVGALLSTLLVVAGVVLAGLALADLGLRAVGVVVAAEVAAKTGMAAVACLGTAPFEGLGKELTDRAGPRGLVVPLALAAATAAATWPHPAAGVALVAGVLTALVVLWWGRRLVGGASGDVFGAANELARVVALHAGVVTWTLW